VPEAGQEGSAAADAKAAEDDPMKAMQDSMDKDDAKKK